MGRVVPSPNTFCQWGRGLPERRDFLLSIPTACMHAEWGQTDARNEVCMTEVMSSRGIPEEVQQGWVGLGGNKKAQ